MTYEDCRRAADVVLSYPGADGLEVVVSGGASAITRYANSQIIQNTVRKETRVFVRAVLGARTATVTTNQLDPAAMRDAAERAVEAARVLPDDETFPGLPEPDAAARPRAVLRWDDTTAAASPQARADAVKEILASSGSGNAAGIVETSASAFGVFSSTGVDCFDAYTRAVTTCLVDTGTGTGWGDASSHRMDEVDFTAAARRAQAKAATPPAADVPEAGTYEVVLEPAAVCTMLEYLAYVGFGAKQVIEGDSFLATLTDQKVAHEAITVADDVIHPLSVGIGFDFEGIAKQKVAVIDRGTARRPVTDLRTARALGTESTGHFSGSTEYGPYASNVVLSAGDRSLEEMIGAVADGFLVTRFHYVNVLDRPETLLTGMTRDGTFRIRDGEITGAVNNFRFAQSALGALASVRGIGSKQEAFAPEYGSFGSTVAPALHVGEFHFASTTSH